MRVPRPFALVRTNDQWLRASHQQTALEGETVQLYWQDNPSSTKADDPFNTLGAGLAFDSHCRLYHSLPDEGRIERLLWAAHDPLQPTTAAASPVDILSETSTDDYGDFSTTARATNVKPRALAVDENDRLFVGNEQHSEILVYDLWSKRLLNRVHLNATPLDLAVHRDKVYALLGSPNGLVELSARGPLKHLKLIPAITNPSRVAVSRRGELFVLNNAGSISATIYSLNSTLALGSPFATDIEFQTHDPLIGTACTSSGLIMVVARRPNEDFRRSCITDSKDSELPPLKARGYDGLGIVCAPDGRIGFWTVNGFRHAVAARLRYFASGSVTTFRLDSGEFHTNWGRLFLDACIPQDTQILVRCITVDEPPEDKLLVRTSPANTTAVPEHDELSPPMPPESIANQLAALPAQQLHRRETGRELPWLRPAETDLFETYEAPIIGKPGRFLWVRLDLSGNTRTTPKFRSLRAEYPTHDYLRRLPQLFSRDDVVASFLRRYLAIFEGQLGELEARADARASLLNPLSAPAEILPWLAGFLGLTTDERMARAPRPGGQTKDVRRTLISEAMSLFRFRGTVRGLRRFVEIYLGTETILIEKFRLRGLGGAILGDSNGPTSSSILGAGLRIGGAIGSEEIQPINSSLEDAFKTHAHRFALIVPALLSSEQQDVVRQILELHRPAHTLVELCTVDAGMRVGRGLHVSVTSVIGRTDGFTQWQLGTTTIGRNTILGRPAAGTTIGASKLGGDTRVG